MNSIDAKNKTYPLIPAEERKCVWMTTGFISYKLCDRNYRCEICPFDQAIKNDVSGEGGFQESEADWTEGSLKLDPSSGVGGSMFYHPDHCWVKVENPEKVRIGIDDLLTQLITHVKVVILPQVGSLTGEGECCAHIIQEDYILPVVCPLSGSIQSANPRLKKNPELIINDPRGDGWLITITPENLEGDLKKLLFGRRALSWFQREEREIVAKAEMILKQNSPPVGPTMQDGGVRINRLKDMIDIIDSKQRAQILDFSITRHKNPKRSMLNPPDKLPSGR